MIVSAMSTLITGVLFISSFPFLCNGKFSMAIKEFYCTHDPEICQNNICRVRTLRQGLNVIDFHCHIPEKINKIEAVFKLLKKNRDGVYEEFAMTAKEDFCAVLSATITSQFFGRIMASLRKYGLQVHKCPLQGNVTLENCPLMLSMFPPIMPSGEYSIKSNATDMEKNKIFISTNFDFVIKF